MLVTYHVVVYFWTRPLPTLYTYNAMVFITLRSTCGRGELTVIFSWVSPSPVVGIFSCVSLYSGVSSLPELNRNWKYKMKNMYKNVFTKFLTSVQDVLFVKTWFSLAAITRVGSVARQQWLWMFNYNDLGYYQCFVSNNFNNPFMSYVILKKHTENSLFFDF